MNTQRKQSFYFLMIFSIAICSCSAAAEKPAGTSVKYENAVKAIYKIMTPVPNLAVRGVFPAEIGFNLLMKYPDQSDKNIQLYEIGVNAAATDTPEITVTLPFLGKPSFGAMQDKMAGSVRWGYNKKNLVELLLFGVAAGNNRTITVKGYYTADNKVKPAFSFSKTVTIPRNRMILFSLAGDSSTAISVSERQPQPPFYEDVSGIDMTVAGEDPVFMQPSSTIEAVDMRTAPVDPTLPVARAKAPAAAEIGREASLDASGSKGNSLSYSWKQVQGPKVSIDGANNVKANFKPVQPGMYRFRLTVADASGSSHTDAEVNVVGAVELKPELIAQTSLETEPRGIHIDGDRLIVTSKTAPEIYIYNISDPSQIRKERKFTLPLPVGDMILDSYLYGDTILTLIKSSKNENGVLLSFRFNGYEKLELTHEIKFDGKNMTGRRNGNLLYIWPEEKPTPDNKDKYYLQLFDITNASHPVEKWKELFNFIYYAVPLPDGHIAVMTSPADASRKHNADIRTVPLKDISDQIIFDTWETPADMYALVATGLPNLKYGIAKFSPPAKFGKIADLMFPDHGLETPFITFGSTVIAVYREGKDSTNSKISFIDCTDPTAPKDIASIAVPFGISELTTDGRILALGNDRVLQIYRLY